MITTSELNSALQSYTPIDTDLVDDLEHYALDKIRVKLTYKDLEGVERELNGLIHEVFTENHAEFLKMDDGRLLRLDQIKKAEPHQHKKT